MDLGLVMVIQKDFLGNCIEKVFKYSLFNIVRMEKKRGMNKKGAEMTIGTIIVIILALVVLVVIIYGFMTGWGNLWGKIIGIGGGKANIDDNVRGCQISCTTSSKTDYCKDRSITFTDNTKPTNSTCEKLALSGQYGLDVCPAIDCSAVSSGLLGKACGGTGWSNAVWSDKAKCTDLGPLYVQINANLILASDRDDVNNRGKICCIQTLGCPSNGWIAQTASSCNIIGRYDITSLITSTERTNNPGKVCCVE
jgi:hypothetical protein